MNSNSKVTNNNTNTSFVFELSRYFSCFSNKHKPPDIENKFEPVYINKSNNIIATGQRAVRISDIFIKQQKEINNNQMQINELNEQIQVLNKDINAIKQVCEGLCNIIETNNIKYTKIKSKKPSPKPLKSSLKKCSPKKSKNKKKVSWGYLPKRFKLSI